MQTKIIFVMPAKASIQVLSLFWMLAFAGMIEIFKLMLPRITDDNVMQSVIVYASQNLKCDGDNLFRALTPCADEVNLKHQVTRVLLRFKMADLHNHAILSGGLEILLRYLNLHQSQFQPNIGFRF